MFEFTPGFASEIEFAPGLALLDFAPGLALFGFAFTTAWCRLKLDPYFIYFSLYFW